MIEYSADGKIAVYGGLKFRKDKKSGYYLCSKKTDAGKRERLHCYIWRTINGEIPEGYQIHHKDHNKDNNEIDNLVLLTAKEHLHHHIETRTEAQRERAKNNMMVNAMPKAKEWHKGKSGREWHKKHYEKMKDALHQKAEFECIVCGKKYTTTITGQNKFCSNNCKSAYRRKQGIDNVTRKCEYCGDEFITNKYSARKYCDKHRSRKSRV